MRPPHIDWIAENGALCTKFYATTPVCSPSRAAFVTGRYPQNTPVTTNNIPMREDSVTFAQTLQQEGYTTGYAGKWHLDGEGKPQWAPARKFGFADNRYMFNRGHWKQLENTPEGPRVKARNKRGEPDYTVTGANEKSFTTDFLADKTVDFIRAHRNQQFCYMVSFPDPHGPNTVRPPYDTMFMGMHFEAPRTSHKPESGLPSWAAKTENAFPGEAMAQYFGMVKCIDDNVGKILDALRVNGLIENTIVVFTADHGDLCGEHARSNKGVPLEASAKVPFLVYFPGKITPGTIVNDALGCIDFLPTLLGLMGIKASGEEEGRDASALLASGNTPAGWKDITFVRGTDRGDGTGWLAAVTSQYKFIVSHQDEPWLLDLREDPDEVTNFFGDERHGVVVKELARELIEYGRRYGDPCTCNPKVAGALKRAAGQEAAGGSMT